MPPVGTLRARRTGNIFEFFYSTDGTNFVTQIRETSQEAELLLLFGQIIHRVGQRADLVLDLAEVLGQMPVFNPESNELRFTGPVETEAYDERGHYEPECGGRHDGQAHDTARNAHRADASTAIGHDLDRPVGRSFVPGTGGSV